MRILIADDSSALPESLQGLFANFFRKEHDSNDTTGVAGDATRLIVSSLSKRQPPHERDRLDLDLDDQQEQSSAILDALGLALLHRGQTEEARPLIERALRIRREFYGEDHPATATSLISRGRLLRREGNLKVAETDVRRALMINSRVFGAESLPVAITLNELAVIQIQLGEFTQAEQSAQGALRILESLHLQCSDPHVTRLMDTLGRVHQVRGNYEHATEIYTSLLGLDRKQVGEKHLKYATHVANFATVEAAQGKLDDAKSHFELAIKIYRDEVRGPRHPDLIDAHANLGSVLRAKGDLKGARHNLQLALELDIEVRGADHPLIGNDHARLGRIDYEGGDFVAAERSFAAALEIYFKNVAAGKFPANHAYIAEAQTWKGRLLVEASGAARAAEAETLIEDALRILPIEFGERSVEQSIASAVLGHALFLQNKDLERAATLLKKSYPIVVAARGAASKIALLIEQWIQELPTERC